MTDYSSNTGIDPRLYKSITPPKPEHDNIQVPDEAEDCNLADLSALTMADFLKQEETPFTITFPGEEKVEFKLDEVKPLTSQIDEAAIARALGGQFQPKERFSVLFLGPQDRAYEQGNFMVSQKETGFKAVVFLVPVQGAYSKEDEKIHVYLEAIFN